MGRWRLDEGKGKVAADASGPPACNGVVHDAAWAKGKSGAAISFDGKRSHDLFLGNYVGSSMHTFDGLIDDVLFYNRAIGPEEIKSLAN